jgi:hypothetical protein
MSIAGSTRGQTVPDKATLFCPDCGHESRFDRDWRVLETNFTTRYLCPVCATAVTVRPKFDDTGPRTPEAATAFWGTWEASLKLWQRAWQTSLCFP